MRRVDEAVREVLSGAITQELKDPRVGFVTVTAVETSPDLRHARVYVCVLGDRPASARRSMDALRSAHGFLQRRVAGELTLKHTPTLDFVYDDTVDRAHADRRAARRARSGASERRQRLARRRATQVLARSARRERFLLVTHENPDGDALGSLAAMQQVLAALGKDAVVFMAADEFPLPYEYRFIQLEGLVTEPPADLERAHDRLPRLRQHRPQPGRRAQARAARTSSTSTTTTTTRTSGRSTTSSPDASCTAEIVWDLMHGLGVEPTQADRRGALRRPRHRHRQVHVREHRPARARDGGRADRRRASTSHAIYRRLYEGIPHGKLELLARGLDQRRALRRRAADPHATSRARTTRATGADENYSEGVVDHLRSRRGHRGRRARARPARQRRAAQRKVSLRATDDRVDVSRDRARARAAAATAGRPASRPTSDYPRAGRVPAGRACAAAALSASTAVLARTTSRRGSPRTTSSRGVRRRLGQGVKVGHAGTLDPFATGLLLVLVGRATRVQRFLMALPKSYETVARLGCTLDHRRPRGRDRAGPRAAGAARAADGRDRASARRPTARSRSAASAPTRWRGRGRTVELAEREVEVHALRAAVARGRPRGVRDRVLVRHLRALADRRPRRRLLPGAAAHGDRPVRRRGRRRRAAHPARRRARLPARRSTLDGDDARARPATAWPSRARAEGDRAGSRDDDGLIALAEPRGGRHAQAHRRLPRLMQRHLAPRRRAPPAPRGRRRVRRRAPRPPRGDPRRRHRAHLRAAPALGGRARGGAQAADHARAQDRPDRRRSASRSWS